MAHASGGARVLRTLSALALPTLSALMVDPERDDAVCRSARDEIGTSTDYLAVPGVVDVGNYDPAAGLDADTWLRRSHALRVPYGGLGPAEIWPQRGDRLVTAYDGDPEVLFTVERVYARADHLLLLMATRQRPSYVTREEMADGPDGLNRALMRLDGTTMRALSYSIVYPAPGTPELTPERARILGQHLVPASSPGPVVQPDPGNLGRST